MIHDFPFSAPPGFDEYTTVESNGVTLWRNKDGTLYSFVSSANPYCWPADMRNAAIVKT